MKLYFIILYYLSAYLAVIFVIIKNKKNHVIEIAALDFCANSDVQCEKSLCLRQSSICGKLCCQPCVKINLYKI